MYILYITEHYHSVICRAHKRGIRECSSHFTHILSLIHFSLKLLHKNCEVCSLQHILSSLSVFRVLLCTTCERCSVLHLPEVHKDMLVSLCQAVVTYVPMLWLVRLTFAMPDPALRDLLLQEEASRQTGGRVTLNAAEQKLDSYLHQLKLQEMSAPHFPPAMHYFKAKPFIEKSSVFKLLQKMPKGEANIFFFKLSCCIDLFCLTLVFKQVQPFISTAHLLSVWNGW